MDATVTVTPKNALDISGWPADIPGAHYLIFFNNAAATKVTIVVERKNPKHNSSSVAA